MKFTNTALLSTAVGLFSGQVANAVESYDVYVERATSTAKLIVDNWYDSSDQQLFGTWWNSAATYLSLSDLGGMVNGRGRVAGHDLHGMWSKLYARYTKKGVSNENFQSQVVGEEGWWALNWIRAWDETKEQRYLDLAADLVNDMNKWQACNGGIWWSKSKDVITAEENVVYFSAASALSTRVSSRVEKEKYARWAGEVWTFLVESQAWNSRTFTVGGNIDYKTCKVVGLNTPSSHTQGLLINGLLEQRTYYRDERYARTASNVAYASITYSEWLSEDGIFQSPVDTFTDDIATYNGVFISSLSKLHRSYPRQEYVTFVTKQADSIWINARMTNGTIGARWQGGQVKGKYSLQCSTNSANQAIIAAASMLKKW